MHSNSGSLPSVLSLEGSVEVLGNCCNMDDVIGVHCFSSSLCLYISFVNKLSIFFVTLKSLQHRLFTVKFDLILNIDSNVLTLILLRCLLLTFVTKENTRSTKALLTERENAAREISASSLKHFIPNAFSISHLGPKFN